MFWPPVLLVSVRITNTILDEELLALTAVPCYGLHGGGGQFRCF
jgi:hypothetical protein